MGDGPKRPGDDRDRLIRKDTPPRGYPIPELAAPHEVPEENTGAIADPAERQLARRKKDTVDRVDRLEVRMDRVEPTVAKMSGQLDGQDRVLAGQNQTLEFIARQVASVTTIHTEQRTQDIRVQGVRATTAIEDGADKRKAMRRILTGLATLAIGGIGFLAHYLAKRWGIL